MHGHELHIKNVFALYNSPKAICTLACSLVAYGCCYDKPNYYDIVLIGNKGQGKSELSEKLVESKIFSKDVRSEDTVLEGTV